MKLSQNNLSEKVISPFTSHFSRKRTAFTLAEVLVTLGIIGVVAALTIPSLVQNHRKQVVEVSLKRFYANMNQAIMLSEAENGSSKDWLFAESTTPENVKKFYNTYLNKYIKTLKTDIIEINGTQFFEILFLDGSASYLTYLGHDWRYCIKAKDLHKFADKRGTGCFVFGFYPNYHWINPNSYAAQMYKTKKFEPYVNDALKDENNKPMFDNGEQLFTTENDLIQQKCYAKVIQLNGWKIPKDYPLKF